MSAGARFYEIGGMTLQVESDLPISDTTFAPKFENFRVRVPGNDVVVIRHHFGLPQLDAVDLGLEVYRHPPWVIYRGGESWTYLCVAPSGAGRDEALQGVAVFSLDHRDCHLYNPERAADVWLQGGLTSLTLLPTDQILLARLLPERGGCLIHSSAVALDGHGLVFAGHSETGKSTIARLVKEAVGERARILCDDRNIVRRWPQGFHVHGTWSHGDLPEVSGGSAPLRALLFLEQHRHDEIIPIGERREIWKLLLGVVIRPLATAEWWQREIDVLGVLVDEAPCYVLRFDTSGGVAGVLEQLLA